MANEKAVAEVVAKIDKVEEDILLRGGLVLRAKAHRDRVVDDRKMGNADWEEILLAQDSLSYQKRMLANAQKRMEELAVHLAEISVPASIPALMENMPESEKAKVGKGLRAAQELAERSEGDGSAKG